jgi:hypothetical protein
MRSYSREKIKYGDIYLEKGINRGLFQGTLPFKLYGVGISSFLKKKIYVGEAILKKKVPLSPSFYPYHNYHKEIYSKYNR